MRFSTSCGAALPTCCRMKISLEPSISAWSHGGFTWSHHRSALSLISLISYIGLSLISECPISDWESGVRYRTERAESDIVSDPGIKFYPISDNQFNIVKFFSWLVYRSPTLFRGGGSNLVEIIIIFYLNVRYIASDFDIGTLPKYLSPISK